MNFKQWWTDWRARQTRPSAERAAQAAWNAAPDGVSKADNLEALRELVMDMVADGCVENDEGGPIVNVPFTHFQRLCRLAGFADLEHVEATIDPGSVETNRNLEIEDVIDVYGQRITKEEAESRLARDLESFPETSVKMFFHNAHKLYFFYDGILMKNWKKLSMDGWHSVRFRVPQAKHHGPFINSVDDVIKVHAAGYDEADPTFLRGDQ